MNMSMTISRTDPLTQKRESYIRVLGKEDSVDSLLGNLQAKFFCQNSGDSDKWAARLLRERFFVTIIGPFQTLSCAYFEPYWL